MARTRTLVDAGPLVAYFHRRDQYFQWTNQQMAQLSAPLFTCEAVLSEAFHLLEDAPHGAQRLLAFLQRGAVEAHFAYNSSAPRLRQLMVAYADQPMSFADACLVCMAEHSPNSRVFTTDNDFRVYRKVNGDKIDVLSPGE